MNWKYLTFILLSIINYSCSQKLNNEQNKLYIDDILNQVDKTLEGSLQNTEVTDLPGGGPLACEWEWTVRTLHYHPASIVPRRMYFSACNTDTEEPLYLSSFTVGENKKHPIEDITTGAIIVSKFNSQTQKLEVINKINFPECQEMHGITTSKDCSIIAALCRIPSGSGGYDKDVLSTHTAADWMTNANQCGDRMNDEMWLYEWTDGNIQNTPKKYIVHKSIGSWEYANNYLKLGENDNTYGIAVKATVGKDNCHEADAFLIMDRTNYTMTHRGWSWACGTGHTLVNRPAYNPLTKKYAMLCSTDFNLEKIPKIGANFFRMEDGVAKQFNTINFVGIRMKGGVSTILPRPDGGFIGLFVGSDEKIVPVEVPLSPPTSIGFIKTDQLGNILEHKWIIQKQDTYLSYTQLIPLENDEYLLGYGIMKKINDPTDTSDESYRIPWEYKFLKIDADGNILTKPKTLEKAGWGEQDQLIYLGNGKVAWSYIEDPSLKSSNNYPECNQSKLVNSVFILE